MRSMVITAAIFALTAGTSLAQVDNQPPADLEATHEGHSPAFSEPAPSAPEAVQENHDSAPALADSAPITEEQAKAKIEGEGFTEISALKMDENGMWTASAMKDGKPVQLSLNEQGNITVIN